MTTIALIGGRPAALAKARAAGFDVVWICLPDEVDLAAAALADEVLAVDYRDLRQLAPAVTALHETRKLAWLVSLTEHGLLPAAHLVDQLGLPGNGVEVVRLLTDKLAMRQALAEAGVSPVPALLGRSEADLSGFVARHGPAVVKPRSGAGSLGVRLVLDPDEVPATWAWLVEFGLVPFLVERYLTGPEYSVEAFSFSGRHEVLAITEKVTGPGFVEVGHTVPAPLPPAAATAVTDLVVRVLDVLGLREGPSHTEVRLTPAGPYLVETHNRRGGDRIIDLVAQVYGVDIDELAFRWYAGGADPLRAPTARGGAAVRFLSAEPGEVLGIDGVTEVLAHPDTLDVDLRVSVGELLRPVEWSGDRPGLVIARGPDAVTARATATALADQITIRTRPRAVVPRALHELVDRPDVVL
jgi:biotin carboxylase